MGRSYKAYEHPIEEIGFCYGGEFSGQGIIFPINVKHHVWVTSDGKKHEYNRTEKFTVAGLRIYQAE